MGEQVGNFCYILPAIVIAILMVRVTYVFYWVGKPLQFSKHECVRTLIILGSGGHTAEMLSIVNVLQKDWFSPRFYVAAATDNMSLQKAQVLEEALVRQGETNSNMKVEAAKFMQIYRSREVGQSYITSIWTTLIAVMHALWLAIKVRPQVIICNGPGTCIPLCAAAFIFKIAGLRWSSIFYVESISRIAGLRWSSIFYVESIARVRKLSLSGLLLYKLRMADQFYVQWPKLQRKYPRSQYVGCLM